MTLHIVKLCVGAESVEDLAEWQIGQLKRARKAKASAIHPKQKAHPVCGTRMWPKRLEDRRGLRRIVRNPFQLFEEIDRGLPARIRILRQTPFHHSIERGWSERLEAGDRRRLGVHDRADQACLEIGRASCRERV